MVSVADLIKARPPRRATDAACQTKTRYASEFLARLTGHKRLRADDVTPGVTRLWPYPCTCCRHWHLTKKPYGTRAVAITADSMWEGVQ